jgi:spermidine synthase
MFINHIPQSIVYGSDRTISAWRYPHRFAYLAAMKPEKSKALLIGMGGGSIAMELQKMDFTLDIVEIDKRMPEIASRFFDFDPEGVNLYVDDGRHYIRFATIKYDLVVMDVLNGENQPYHLFTLEAFGELKKILKNDALILINFQGYLYGDHGIAARSILRTLKASGFHVQYFFAGNKENDGDLHFYASLEEMDFHTINPFRVNSCCKELLNKFEDLITDTDISTDDAILLTDDKPQLEILNTYWNEKWRTETVNIDQENLAKYRIPFFK